jgi:hypothetical protein
MLSTFKIFQLGTSKKVPYAPIIGIATATSTTSATVVFIAPISNGGPAITSYTATSNPGNITGTLNQAGSGTITVNGLTTNTDYTFTVKATNSIGTSAASDPSNSITTYAVPVNIVAPVVSGTATYDEILTTTTGTWTGVPAITYTYQWQRNAVNISGATSSTYRLVSADTGTAIGCVVTATNLAGVVSANSNTTSNVIAIVPDAPTITSAAAITNTSAKIVFTAPVRDGGTSITSYIVTSNPGSITATLNQAGSGTITITGLTPTTTYTFTVKAVNAIGQSAPSAASANVSTPTITFTGSYLLVGGGASGVTGGGGAGGLLQGNIDISPGLVYAITIGAGGSSNGADGNSSYFDTICAYGGGGGGGTYGNNGASGGGSNQKFTPADGEPDQYFYFGGKGIYPGSPYISAPRQGFDGANGAPSETGNLGGGGGGSASAGKWADEYYKAGYGGSATTIAAGIYTVSSFAIAGGGGGGGAFAYYGAAGGGGGAGGGGSDAGFANSTGGTATVNSGSGGGGAGYLGSVAGKGGSGILTIAYPDSQPDLTSIDVGLVTQYWTGTAWANNPAGTTTSVTNVRSGYKIYRFVSGTGTIS